MSLCVFWFVLVMVDEVTVLLFFFFSSRRRHTRSLCDWSSDVCSSDLPQQELVSIKSVGAAATSNGQYKKRGAAATRIGQKSRGAAASRIGQ